MADNAKHEALKEALQNGKLSNVNGAINHMKKEDIRKQLKLVGLDDRLVILIFCVLKHIVQKPVTKPCQLLRYFNSSICPCCLFNL